MTLSMLQSISGMIKHDLMTSCLIECQCLFFNEQVDLLHQWRALTQSIHKSSLKDLGRGLLLRTLIAVENT